MLIVLMNCFAYIFRYFVYISFIQWAVIYWACQILPCQKTVVGGGEPTEGNFEPPDSLQLEHVYGFTAGISRQAVMYSPDGELLFFGRCSGGFNNESEIAFAKVYVRRFHRRPALLLHERKTTRQRLPRRLLKCRPWMAAITKKLLKVLRC